MKKIVLTLTLILLSPIFAIPAIANPFKSSQTTIDRGEYQYADGSGNLYLIDRGSIEYRPITRAESSSGNYDGGAPKTVKITDRQYRQVAAMIDRALDRKSIQVGNGKNGRAKGTGIIYKRVKDRQILTQVIDRDSRSRTEIEVLLKQLLIQK
ncbi:hypothetical protein [Chamaesiphon minutus]|uniref:Uncharacterized protein n=1 Tax=Chamaesiphon minutus (strain ATCC 27169 / PCC 6605) TaxID=1173020 RepID=K9UJB8_CHAP6|nr:hypothetical protein [Chamaesiphon minutus]AFY94274.1 hypothetical protein Cha6605_3267 [Chamaesiphon minutus PCC 6605]